jgi:predicted metal-dependent TIM-barrel fold hydrolase
MELWPLYLHNENVGGIGEIGYDDQTPAEDKYFRAQLELAKELDLLVQVHTPHRDKKEGTRKSMEVCLEHGLKPSQVIIDHNNEETVQDVLDKGFWAAFTIYPKTKMGNARMVEVVKRFGSDRIIVDSSADWGISDPMAVPKTAGLMLRSGVSREDVIKACYSNALEAYSQTGVMKEEHWKNAKGIDQSQLFNDNSILRGQTPRIDSEQIE